MNTQEIEKEIDKLNREHSVGSGMSIEECDLGYDDCSDKVDILVLKAKLSQRQEDLKEELEFLSTFYNMCSTNKSKLIEDRISSIKEELKDKMEEGK